MAVGNKPLLEVINLRTYFFTRWGVVKAVDGVSFRLEEGRTLGLVGESGCGKTMTCLSILRLVPEPGARTVSGRILFEGEDLLAKSQAEMRRFRGKRISMILQDPMTSLDPVFTIGSQLAEAIETHQKVRASGGVWGRVQEMLRLVEIPSPEVRMRNYPHEMSGGMRQRVVGAIALSCEPRLLIADEPTTSLDVTTQAQYLRLLKDIQARSRVGMIFITHDLGIAAKMCDRVAVMYAGKIVEEANVRRIFGEPAHPYTVALMKSLPKLECKTDRLFSIEGQPPTLHNLPPGCSFAPRCPEVMETCRREYPPVVSAGDDHRLACWLKA